MNEPGPIIHQGRPEMPYFLDDEFTIAARDLGGGEWLHLGWLTGARMRINVANEMGMEEFW